MQTQLQTNRLNRRKGFTIVELVIVIAVLAILIGILVPTFSGMLEDSRQRALRMDLDAVYTAYAADCGFRDEPVQNMDQYIFVPEDAVARNGNSMDASKLTFTDEGYKWTGSEEAKVEYIPSSQLNTLYDSKAVLYGPFNSYYLMGLNQAYLWEGEGSAAKPYLIKSYRDLRSIGEHTARGDTFSGKYFLLTTDLSISQDNWLPIGGFLSPSQEVGLNAPKNFSGIFNGNGHTITLSYGRVERDKYCLFGQIKNATICNLKTAGSIDVNSYAGGIVGIAESSTIYNCVNSATVSGDMNVGGIVAYSFQSTINNCVNTGDVTGYFNGTAGSFVGGIVGETGKSTVENCRNEGNIIAHAGVVGGIAGNAWGTIRNCVNAGSVTAYYTADVTGVGTGLNDALAGGIAGYGGEEFTVKSGEAIIDGCMNTGAVTASGRCAGGIIGANPKSITNCVNTGTITAEGYVGGIAGVINKAGTTVANVLNSGLVVSLGDSSSANHEGPVGGIIGRLAFKDAWTLTLAVSGGEVHYRKGASVTAYNDLGMFIGSAGGTVTLKNAYLSTSAGATIGTKTGVAQNMGKSISVSGTPTTQTNQDTLRTAINNVISGSYAGKGYRAWVIKAGYQNGRALPTITDSASFNLINGLPAGAQVKLLLNTHFAGASSMYLPYLDRTVVIIDGNQYTFKHWTVNGKTYQPGASLSLTGDAVVSAVWEKQPNITIKPIPFQ